MLRSWILVIALTSSVSGFTVTPFLTLPGLRRDVTVFRASSEEEQEDEFIRVPRRKQRGRLYDRQEDEDAFYDSVEQSIYGNDESVDDEDWDDEDEDDEDDDEDEDYGIFSNVLIDNPILDRIDPDGAAERFPELARDPRFWFDMVLFIAFLNFLSAIGPQNYFPDLPYTV